MNRKALAVQILVAAVLTVASILTHNPHVLVGAAVTIAAGYPKRDFTLARKVKIFKINIAGSGDTLDTGMRLPSGDVEVSMDPNSSITSISKSIVNGQVRLTFTVGGAINNIILRVSARQ